MSTTTTTTRRTLNQELADQRRRLAAAQRHERVAHAASEVARKRISQIEARLRLGAGHILTPDPDPAARNTALASCRLCGTVAGSLNSERPCPGDTHGCPSVVEEGATATAWKGYEREHWRCGQPGRFAEDFGTWTCAAGHLVGGPDNHGRLGDGVGGVHPEATYECPVRGYSGHGCPCGYLITLTDAGREAEE